MSAAAERANEDEKFGEWGDDGTSREKGELVAEAMTGSDNVQTKLCARCGEQKPLAEFKRRSGKRRGATARRGTCRACREEMLEAEAAVVDAAASVEAREAVEPVLVVAESPEEEEAVPPAKKKRRRRRRRSKKAGASREVAVADEALEVAVTEPVAEEFDGAFEPGEIDTEEEAPAKKKRRRRRRSKKAKAGVGEGTTDASVAAEAVSAAEVIAEKTFVYTVSPRAMRELGLKPTWGGFIRMRGKTDNGRKWYQEIDPDLAYTLVTENAAVVVNRHTIRRLYSNKEFRRLILERDRYTCYFCKEYGDTIDHLLPRAKGGHTTPDNCVCACNLCNQSKADKDLEVFMNDRDFG